MKYSPSQLINCKTAEDVQRAVREWTSDKSDKEHLIRSSILDMHAGIEKLLKQILFWHMLNILFQDGDQNKDRQRKDKLEKTINKMGFMDMYRLLKPCFDAFPAPDLKNINPINDARNLAVHEDVKKIVYKGKNPFTDHETLAELFLDCWASKKELRHFYERMISDPKAMAKTYYEFYKKHQ